MRKWRERDCARRAAQTINERQATSQRKSTRERERTAAEDTEERDFLASISTQSLTNACIVAATSTFRSYTALPTT